MSSVYTVFPLSDELVGCSSVRVSLPCHNFVHQLGNCLWQMKPNLKERNCSPWDGMPVTIWRTFTYHIMCNSLIKKKNFPIKSGLYWEKEKASSV